MEDIKTSIDFDLALWSNLKKNTHVNNAFSKVAEKQLKKLENYQVPQLRAKLFNSVSDLEGCIVKNGYFLKFDHKVRINENFDNFHTYNFSNDTYKLFRVRFGRNYEKTKHFLKVDIRSQKLVKSRNFNFRELN